MKNTLEPVKDRSRKTASKKEVKGLPKQTPYEQYEESGSVEEDSFIEEGDSSNFLSANHGFVGDMFLPSHVSTCTINAAKISREARETMQECVTEFLLFVTSEAQEICEEKKRKTIQGEDIIEAMKKLDFERYADMTQRYFLKYKQT
jgi:histone H3/H4